MAFHSHPSDRPRYHGDTTAPSPASTRLQHGQLPRFHPANFPSGNPSSIQTSSRPITIPGSSSPRLRNQPLQPNFSNRPHSSSAQEQLYAQQKDLVNNRYNTYQTAQLSPRLAAMTLREPVTSLRLRPREVSPGPMTPLDLEERDGYNFPEGSSPKQVSEEDKDEVLEAYIAREEGTIRPTSPVDRRISRSPHFMAVKNGDSTRHRSQLAR